MICHDFVGGFTTQNTVLALADVLMRLHTLHTVKMANTISLHYSQISRCTSKNLTIHTVREINSIVCMVPCTQVDIIWFMCIMCVSSNVNILSRYHNISLQKIKTVHIQLLPSNTRWDAGCEPSSASCFHPCSSFVASSISLFTWSSNSAPLSKI